MFNPFKKKEAPPPPPSTEYDRPPRLSCRPRDFYKFYVDAPNAPTNVINSLHKYISSYGAASYMFLDKFITHIITDKPVQEVQQLPVVKACGTRVVAFNDFVTKIVSSYKSSKAVGRPPLSPTLRRALSKPKAPKLLDLVCKEEDQGLLNVRMNRTSKMIKPLFDENDDYIFDPEEVKRRFAVYQEALDEKLRNSDTILFSKIDSISYHFKFFRNPFLQVVENTHEFASFQKEYFPSPASTKKKEPSDKDKGTTNERETVYQTYPALNLHSIDGCPFVYQHFGVPKDYFKGLPTAEEVAAEEERLNKLCPPPTKVHTLKERREMQLAEISKQELLVQEKETDNEKDEEDDDDWEDVEEDDDIGQYLDEEEIANYTRHKPAFCEVCFVKCDDIDAHIELDSHKQMLHKDEDYNDLILAFAMIPRRKNLDGTESEPIFKSATSYNDVKKPPVILETTQPAPSGENSLLVGTKRSPEASLSGISDSKKSRLEVNSKNTLTEEACPEAVSSKSILNPEPLLPRYCSIPLQPLRLLVGDPANADKTRPPINDKNTIVSQKGGMTSLGPLNQNPCVLPQKSPAKVYITPSPHNTEKIVKQQLISTSASSCFPLPRNADDLTPIQIYEDPGTPQVPIVETIPKVQRNAVEKSALLVGDSNKENSYNPVKVEASIKAIVNQGPNMTKNTEMATKASSPRGVVRAVRLTLSGDQVKINPSPNIAKPLTLLGDVKEEPLPRDIPIRSVPNEVADKVNDTGTAAKVKGMKHQAPCDDEQVAQTQVLPNNTQAKRLPLADISTKTLDKMTAGEHKSTTQLSQSKENAPDLEVFARQSQLLPHNLITSSELEEPSCLGRYELIETEKEENIFLLREDRSSMKRSVEALNSSSSEIDEDHLDKLIHSSPLFRLSGKRSRR